jgi:hypothetical protein
MDIVARIEKQLDSEDLDMCDLLSLLEDSANAIRKLRGEPEKAKGF